MGFDGEDRPQVLLPENREKVGKRDAPLPYRQVLIGRAVVVVNVDFTQKIAQVIHPEAKRRPAEGMGVPGVKTETNLGRGKRVQQEFHLSGILFVDVLQCDKRLHAVNDPEETPPGFEAVFKPLLFGGDVVSLWRRRSTVIWRIRGSSAPGLRSMKGA